MIALQKFKLQSSGLW